VISDEVHERVITHPHTIPVGDRRLSARRFAPADPAHEGDRPGLLFVHGLDSEQSGYADRAEAAVSRLGAVCLTFDLGGHGGSDGSLRSLTPRDNLADVVAAFDTLVGDKLVDGARIGVCGASYGAYLAALLTADRHVARLLLRAPGLYDDRELDKTLDSPKKSNRFASAREITRRLQHYAGAVLILEGEFDDVIPHEIIEVYLEACRDAQHAVIPRARHALVDEVTRAYFRNSIVDFFADL
jgi:uncharacterized protein